MGSTNTISSQLQIDSDVRRTVSNGRDNMVGQAAFRGLDMLCPISTSSSLAIAEEPELRAYKLGKQKCSYNQVELVIKDVGTGKLGELKVSEAIETCVGPEVDDQLRDSCLKFNVRFVNNNRMYLYIYVVYATPYSTATTNKHSAMTYHWIPVTRSKCRKGCKGPVIRGLQRFGRMPRRNATTLDGEDSWKEPRHLYIAIDEASTHVCSRHETSKFRLLVAAYDDKNQLLGTTVSSSIRVLANNDAPLGAASFKLHCHIKGGWGAVGQPGSTENASSPRSYITDEKSRQVEHTRAILTEDKEVDQEFLSAYKSRRIASVDEECEYLKVDKEHTLTDLSHRLFQFCVAKQEHGQTTVTLRSLANTLGARRRRVLEILSVLESVQVIHHQGKERYLWIGSREIAGALVKLKNSIPGVGEPKDTNRNILSPGIRRAKLKTSLSRQIEEMRTEAHDPLRTLSKRFIQLFLVHEGYPLPWEKILQSIVDGPGQDPETIRAKRRRLGEIARIFSALHLIRRASDNQKLKPGLAYEWLGTQGVLDHLQSIINTLGLVQGRSTKTHHDRVKSPTTQEKRGSGGIRRRNVYDHVFRSGQVTVDDQISGELSSQPEPPISHKISPIPRWRVQTAASLPKKTISSTLQEIHNYQTQIDFHHYSNTFKRRRTLLDVGIHHSPCSSETEDEASTFVNEAAEEGSIATETCRGEQGPCQLSYPGRWDECLRPKIMDNSHDVLEVQSHLVSEPKEPHDNEAAHHCGPDLTLQEENKLQQSSVIKPLATCTSEDHIAGVSSSSAHQFPYKKRKFLTSFTCFAESKDSDSSRDSEKLSHGHELDELPQDSHLENLPSTFDPLFHLFCFYSPERIFELQSQNPAFLFTYVKESRALYNKWCAQHAGPTLIRPIAKVGKVSIADSGPGIPFTISRRYQPNIFFTASEQVSDLKRRLLKGRSRLKFSTLQMQSSPSASS